MSCIELTVNEEQAGERLSIFLSRCPAVGSRKRAERWLKAGLIQNNGQPASGARRTEAGDCIVITPPISSNPVWEYALEVVFENDHFAVIDKPAGIHVSGNVPRTIRRALPSNLRPSQAQNKLPHPEPLHRLDRRTSGLLAVAKTIPAQIELHRAFAERRVQKRYTAVVTGSAVDGESRAPIDGRTAHSAWRVLQRAPHPSRGWLSIIEVEIFTGRTHQIRRHLSAAGHPILGDDLYNGEFPPLRGKGLFLCATSLSLPDPFDGTMHQLQKSIPRKYLRLLKRQALRAQHPETR